MCFVVLITMFKYMRASQVGLTTHCAQVFGLLQFEPHDKNMCVHTYSRTCTFVSLGYRIHGTESFLLPWLGTRWF